MCPERAQASGALDELGLSEGIPYLEQAIAQEKEKAVLRSMLPILQNLKHHAVVKGRVFDAHGQPVPGALVSLPWPDPLCEGFKNFRTDREGRYRIRCYPENPTQAAFGVYTQNTRPEDDKDKAVVVVTPGAHVRLDFHLAPIGLLEGNVMDSLTGAKISNAQIKMLRKELQAE